MSNKQFILKNFKTVFEQYIEYIENNIESQKYEIAYMKQVISLMIRFNASALLKLWFNYVTIPYGEIVLRGDYDYFTEKNYNNDLKDIDQSNVSYVLNVLEDTKRMAKNIDDDKKKEIISYNQKTNKTKYNVFQ